MQKVTEEVLASIKSDKQLAAGDKQKALKLAEEKVLPYIDFERVDAPRRRPGLVAGHARAAQEAGERVPQHAGADLLERDRVLPGADAEGACLRAAAKATQRTRRRCARSSSAPAASRCRSSSRCATIGKSWKVYDISVEGISLVLTYRSEFDAVVKQEGVDGLIKRLTQKNSPAKLG